MKNQYVGDIGDYTKLGLLRALQNEGLSVGVNWYLTPDDPKKSTDGKYVEYLESVDEMPDQQLFNGLKMIIDKSKIDKSERSLDKLDKLLPGVKQHLDPLDFSKFKKQKHLKRCDEMKKQRDNWHQKAKEELKGVDVVFLDPDNGLEIGSFSPDRLDSNKYVTYAEVYDYYNEKINTDKKTSVMVYQHRDHSKPATYLSRFTRFKKEGLLHADVFFVHAKCRSVRDYLFIAHKEHTEQIKTALATMLAEGWSRFLEEATDPQVALENLA